MLSSMDLLVMAPSDWPRAVDFPSRRRRKGEEVAEEEKWNGYIC